MQTQSIIPINFGIRPSLKVQRKNQKLFESVADFFDIYNKKLKGIPYEYKYYEIEQNNRGLLFAEYSDQWQFSVKFGKKLTQELLKKPADYIARTLAKAAEAFALDDKYWSKFFKFGESVCKDKKLNMSENVRGKFSDEIAKLYSDYVLATLSDNLKENEFLAKANIHWS